GGPLEAIERLHNLATRKTLDPESATACLLNVLRQPLSRPLEHVERRRPGRGHAPLNFGLSDGVWSIGNDGSRRGRHRAARLREKSASVGHHTPPLSWNRDTHAITQKVNGDY